MLIAIGLAACGGDDEGPSKAEYIEKADAICAAADPKLDEIWRDAAADPSPSQAQAGLRALVPEDRKLLSELRALEKPADDQDEIDRVWAARERAVDGMEAAARSPETSLAYVEADDPPGWDEAERLAGVYGMVDCEATQPGSVAA